MAKRRVTKNIKLPAVKKGRPIPNGATKVLKDTLSNGLGEALGFDSAFGSIMDPNGLAGFPGPGASKQPVEDTASLFTNLRWYFVSNFRQVLSQLYAEIGLVQTIVRVPVDDAFRGGIMLKTEQLDEDEVRELQISLDRDGDLATAKEAGYWNRLYGGAGIMILVDDQDPELPLNLKSIGQNTNLEFRAVDMWELFWDKQNAEGYDPQIQAQDFQFYSYYSEKVHKSRVMRLKGPSAPSFLRPRLRGWGLSVVEALVRSINQYLKATDLSYEVLDEFKVDVYRMNQLVQTLSSPQGTERVRRQIAITNWHKNYQNAIVLDKEDEYEQKQISFTGIAEAMDGIRMQVAADMRMPITKLFGTSASKGMGQTDQNDMENYNSMVEAEVRDKLKYDILRMCEIKCQKLFGMIPSDLQLEFKPLRELTAVDQETVKTQKMERLIKLASISQISALELKDAVNKGNLVDVHMDTEGESLEPIDMAGEEDGKDPNKKTDVDDPGANREDSRKVRIGDNKKSTKGETT